MELFLTGYNNSCAQDDVIRGELDVFYEGASMLRCPRCEVICSSGKDANSHWKEAHGENVVSYTCGKCEKKFELPTQVSCHFARCRGQKSASKSRRRFEFRCELCTLGYDFQSRLSQHMRARHPEEFHMRLKVEDNRKQKGYEDAELITLAEAEVNLPPDTGYVNKALAVLGRIERTSEQIRQMRKCARYKELVQELEREHADQNLIMEKWRNCHLPCNHLCVIL